MISSFQSILHFSTLPLLLLVLSNVGSPQASALPAPAQFYDDQLVDHLCSDDCPYNQQRWTQRYYTFGDHFGGPGSPIFLVLGGEGAIEPERGLYYGFVTNVLAKSFGAFVVQPEHRFYGDSQPICINGWRQEQIEQGRHDPDPRIQLLTIEQALRDDLRLTNKLKEQLGCAQASEKDSPHYCPVITVGGSYPGFMSAMARLVYPDEVDMGYAASAPMKFYSQKTPQSAYYEHITQVAEKAQTGCAAAVKKTLLEVQQAYMSEGARDYRHTAFQIGICNGTVPGYVDSAKSFLDEVFMMVGYTFANNNMWYYPPSTDSALVKGCQVFMNDKISSEERLGQFLVTSLAGNVNTCLDMRQQLPSGPFRSISGGDWSGIGTGTSGESWDFETCTLLVEAIGFDESKTMFPDRPWSLAWMGRHCRERFGVTPRPYELVQRWHWDDLAGKTNASRILFTNGLNDGWSVSGIQEDLSDSLLAINFPNGAHHSELRPDIPDQNVDTPDVWEGFQKIENILKQWLEELPGGVHSKQVDYESMS